MRYLIHRRRDPQVAPPADFSFLSESRPYGTKSGMKSRSFAYSLVFHAAVVTFLLLQKGNPENSSRPIYDTLIRPQENRIIWQPLNRKLPNIDSSTNPVKQAPSRGKLRSPQVVIAQSKLGSSKEFVFQDKPVELPPDVKAPNLIALRPPAILETQPSPPPPPKPREFVPPPAAVRPQPAQLAALPLAPPPVVDTSPKVTMSLPQVMQANQAKVYRRFVAPQAVKKTGVGTGTVSMPDAPKVDLNSDANIAAVNLDSVLGTASTLPPGRRPGNFSAAPVNGEPAAEKSSGAALVPGLTVRGANHGDSAPAVRPETAAPPATPTREIAYHEVMSRPIGSSLSVALKPGARRIPAALDMQFRDRPVYTMILPAPKMPQYAGDWVLWFGELKPSDGLVQIHAPLPEKQVVPEAPSPYTWGTEADIRIHLVIDEGGHVQSPSIGRIPSDMPAQIALEDLRAWQFKPATRNGVPIPVEVVLDIPFRRIVSSDSKH
jgi:hypothetical protein